MIHYLFDDIFYKFRFFFNSQKYKDSKFLYDISFGLKPRKFEPSDDEKLIYDEEDEVSEMYFIQEGTVSFLISLNRLELGTTCSVRVFQRSSTNLEST